MTSKLLGNGSLAEVIQATDLKPPLARACTRGRVNWHVWSEQHERPCKPCHPRPKHPASVTPQPPPLFATAAPAYWFHTQRCRRNERRWPPPRLGDAAAGDAAVTLAGLPVGMRGGREVSCQAPQRRRSVNGRRRWRQRRRSGADGTHACVETAGWGHTHAKRALDGA